jgi:uncharacterized cofD-like protein
MKRIVVIGGGTGVYTVLSGLKTYDFHLSAIVSMADDGGSTGVLREEFGVLPPGDIRRALISLSDSEVTLAKLFNYRFEQGNTFAGHSLGNLLITALERITGSFDLAIKEAVKILNVNGDVIPVTLESSRLCAELENGEIVRGETNIDVPKHDGNLKIKRIFLDPTVTINPDAIKAIEMADAVVLGPGDLYTSVLPNLVVEGMTDAIKNTKAKKIYIVNVMTKFGETNGFAASDFVKEIEQYLGKDTLDYSVVNTSHPSLELLEKYQEYKDELVKYDEQNFGNIKSKVIAGDFIRQGQFVRHDSEKLAEGIIQIFED